MRKGLIYSSIMILLTNWQENAGNLTLVGPYSRLTSSLLTVLLQVPS